MKFKSTTVGSVCRPVYGDTHFTDKFFEVHVILEIFTILLHHIIF